MEDGKSSTNLNENMLDAHESKCNQYMMEAYLVMISGMRHSIGGWTAVAAVQDVAYVMIYGRSQVTQLERFN